MGSGSSSAGGQRSSVVRVQPARDPLTSDPTSPSTHVINIKSSRSYDENDNSTINRTGDHSAEERSCRDAGGNSVTTPEQVTRRQDTRKSPTQGLPYPLNHGTAAGQGSGVTQERPLTQNNYNTLIKQTSVLMPNKPLADVPFQLASTYEELKSLTKFQVPEVHYRSMVDIENEYGYDFRIERTAAARLPPDV